METNIDYRDILKGIFTDRSKKEANLSLRAFASEIEITASQLSRVFAKKRHISLLTARTISQKLFKKDRERDYFLSLVEYGVSKTANQKEWALRNAKRSKPDDDWVNEKLDEHLIYSQWYHKVILELLAHKDFSSSRAQSPAKIARFLGLKEIEVKLAIDRLLACGYVNMIRGKLEKADMPWRPPTGFSSHEFNAPHESLLQLAEDKLKSLPTEDRHYAHRTLLVNEDEMMEVKELVEDFQSRLSSFLESSSRNNDKNKLLQLNLQLFDLQA